MLQHVRITVVVDRETVAKIFVCRGFALEMVCTLRNAALRWKISFRSVRRASATLSTPARGSLLVLLSTDPQLTPSSPSQRPTHSGSIFRLLLKIAVSLTAFNVTFSIFVRLRAANNISSNKINGSAGGNRTHA